jgi:hypothetical protein
MVEVEVEVEMVEVEVEVEEMEEMEEEVEVEMEAVVAVVEVEGTVDGESGEREADATAADDNDAAEASTGDEEACVALYEGGGAVGSGAKPDSASQCALSWLTDTPSSVLVGALPSRTGGWPA